MKTSEFRRCLGHGATWIFVVEQCPLLNSTVTGHLESNALEDSDRYLNTYCLSLIVRAFLHRNLLDHEHRTIKANIREPLAFKGIPYGCRENIENNNSLDDVTRLLIYSDARGLRAEVVL